MHKFTRDHPSHSNIVPTAHIGCQRHLTLIRSTLSDIISIAISNIKKLAKFNIAINMNKLKVHQ